jgi:hypothetical protein
VGHVCVLTGGGGRRQRQESAADSDDASMQPEQGSISATFHFSKSVPAATVRPAVLLVRNRRMHRAAQPSRRALELLVEACHPGARSCLASPRPHNKSTKHHAPHYSTASASTGATAAGVPMWASISKRRYRHAAYHADDYAAASISSSRLVIRERAALLPPHHCPPRRTRNQNFGAGRRVGRINGTRSRVRGIRGAGSEGIARRPHSPKIMSGREEWRGRSRFSFLPSLLDRAVCRFSIF